MKKSNWFFMVILALAVGIGGMSCGGGDDSVLMVPVTPATVAAPVAYPPGGTTMMNATTVADGQRVTLSTPTDGAVIYYTIDGRDPKMYGSVYDPIQGISSSSSSMMQIRAIARKVGPYDSGEMTAMYMISSTNLVTDTSFAWKATGASGAVINTDITSSSSGPVWVYINNDVAEVNITTSSLTDKTLTKGGTDAAVVTVDNSANNRVTVDTTSIKAGGTKTFTLTASGDSLRPKYYAVTVVVGAPIPSEYQTGTTFTYSGSLSNGSNTYGSSFTVDASKIMGTATGASSETDVITGVSTSPGGSGSFSVQGITYTGRWDYVYSGGYKIGIAYSWDIENIKQKGIFLSSSSHNILSSIGFIPVIYDISSTYSGYLTYVFIPSSTSSSE